MLKIRRRRHRFRPVVDLGSEGASVLDRRLLLSVDAGKGVHPDHLAAHPARPAAAHPEKSAASGRLGPKAEINKVFSQFVAGFSSVTESYVSTLSQQSTGTISVSATLTAPYTSGSSTMTVNDAAVFGPSGTFSTPVTATAQVLGVPTGQYTLLGSNGNQLIINTALSSTASLPAGTVLTANVPASAQNSAASVFPSYIIASTDQMAVELVGYFSSLPIKLPRKYAPPHQNAEGGALQQFAYQVIAGSSSTSLEQLLIGITLPTTAGGDLEIYEATVDSAVTAKQLQMLDGVEQIFAGKYQIVSNTSSSSSTSTSGTSSTSTSGTSSTGTAT